MSSSRREFLTRSALVLPAATFASRVARAAQAGTPAPVVVPVFTPVRRNVGYFTGRGGTIGYLIAPDGVVVVDSQFPDSAPLCLAGLNQRSGNRAIDMLINTHHHGDHTGGNAAFRGATKRVVAHETAAAHMKQPPGRPAPTGDQYYPTETFAGTWSATIGDERVRARHYGRAHTSGDIVVTFERANVAQMGDMLVNGRQAVADRPAGAQLSNWIGVLERVVADHDADTVYIVGHAEGAAPVTVSRTDVLGMRDYLTALLTFVRAQRTSGTSREQLVAITAPLPGFERRGALTPALLGAAFDELAG